MSNNVIVLGAGIAGIAAGYYLNQEGIQSTVYEQNFSWGGLCDNFEIDGFLFDTFVHLAFSNNQTVNEIFEKSTKVINHINEPDSYYKGKYFRHPVQNNLFQLELDDKVKIIKDFIDRDSNKPINNYEDWLNAQYGESFAKLFPMCYTRKYWTTEAKNLETKWISVRMHVPSIDEILRGAMHDEENNFNYAKNLRYPTHGGFKKFFQYMVDRTDIMCNKRIIEIDIDNKLVTFEDGTNTRYIDGVISTLPLTEMCKITKALPDTVQKASELLEYASGAIISLGFNKSDIAKKLMFYVYDEDIFPSRIFSPSMKSPNNAPEGCSSLQAEIYYSKLKPLEETLPEILQKTIKKMVEMGLFEEEDIIVKDIRTVEYANVIFKHDIYVNRKIVKDYFLKKKIICAGRFGEWDYLWSDQSFLSGMSAALSFCK